MTIGYFIEKAAGLFRLPGILIRVIIVLYLAVMLGYPIVMIQWIDSQPLSALYFMLFSTAWALKLISFHHVMWDNRALLKRIKHDKPDLFKTSGRVDL